MRGQVVFQQPQRVSWLRVCVSRPTGQTHAITKDRWAGAGVITLLRVIAAGGCDDTRKGVDYLVILVNGVEVWRGFSH